MSSIIFFFIFWSFHNCTRLCWTAKANRSHHVASQNIENVIFFFNECLLPFSFSFCFLKGHTSLAICQHLFQYSVYPIPQYLKKNWQILKYRVENRRNTDITFMIGHAYLKLYSSPMFISNIYKPEINLSHREKTWEDLKLICPTIEKPGYWISCQFYHRQEPIKWCHRLMVGKRAYAHAKNQTTVLKNPLLDR